MIEQQVPEMADGGYWYVREAVPEADDAPGWNYGDIPVGAAAWYADINGVRYCAIRTVEPITDMPTADAVTVAEIVGAEKPRARIGGQ